MFKDTSPVMSQLVSHSNKVAMLRWGEEDDPNIIYGETTICEGIRYGGSANIPTNTLPSYSHFDKDYI